MAALSRARVLHRDLTEPGKNALIKRDGAGLTAALIDLGQSEVCPDKRGAAGRALKMCTPSPLPPSNRSERLPAACRSHMVSGV